MHFVQSSNLPVCRAVIAKARDCVALQGRFGAGILLPGLVGMDAIHGRERMVHISRKLVSPHRAWR
jgi:hypothetical protein